MACPNIYPREFRERYVRNVVEVRHREDRIRRKRSSLISDLRPDCTRADSGDGCARKSSPKSKLPKASSRGFR